MFDLLKAAQRLPQLQCAWPAYFAFSAGVSSGALGRTMMMLASPQARDGLPQLDRSFFNRNEE